MSGAAGRWSGCTGGRDMGDKAAEPVSADHLATSRPTLRPPIPPGSWGSWQLPSGLSSIRDAVLRLGVIARAGHSPQLARHPCCMVHSVVDRNAQANERPYDVRVASPASRHCSGQARPHLQSRWRAASGCLCQRHGPEIATPGAPFVDVLTTLATSWKPAVTLYIQIVPSSVASHTRSPSLTDSGERVPATPASPTRP